MDHQHFLCAALCILTISLFCFGANTLSANQTLADGEGLISPGKTFELGFFSPGSSTNRFLGIRYRATPDVVVWVANRHNPIVSRQGVVTLANDGTLVLSTAQRSNIWSSNITRAASSPVLQLLDSGNLVVVDKATADSSWQESHVWQSFDHPGDTLLPGMKMVHDPETGEEKHLTSWRSADDPSIGEFSYKIENQGLSQAIIVKGVEKVHRAIFWDGRFPGFQNLPVRAWKTEISTNRGRLISIFQPFNASVNTRLTMNYSGSTHRYVMNEQKDGWILMITGPRDLCDSYGLCGRNSIRSLTLDCQKEDGFLRVEGLKFPDSLNYRLNTSMGIGECGDECLKNCTCSAYADPYFKNETSCLMWFGHLIDTREQTVEPGGGPNIYIRVPVSETELETAWKERRNRHNKTKIILISAVSISGMLILGLSFGGLLLKMRSKTQDQERRGLLTWPKRFDIMMGIARGMIYLHHDSRLKIIHRDLKTSNILLDENLNAKISDFGLARMFEGDQTTARTKRVVGTYGYMAPEYAFDGKFSIKSDVFSLGVVILEIVSGRKNSGFKHPSNYHNLLEQAWLLWQENRELEMMDPCYKSSYVEPQVKRCIQIGLLCVQNAAEDRPMMLSVVLMLSTEDTVLPQPEKPGFFLQSSSSFSKRKATGSEKPSSATITMSDVEAR